MRPDQSSAELERLAAKLGRPITGLSAFRSLTPAQIGLLNDAIDRARARRAHALETALGQRLPALPRRIAIALVRAERR